jgi:hypothetical protein
MYLFTRSARLGPGKFRQSMAWAVEITEKVNQIGELQVRLWTTMLSPGVGRLVWTTGTEDLTQIEDSMTKLMGDEAYLDLLDRGAEFSSGDPVDDQIVELVYPGSDPEADFEYVAVVSATAANGHFAHAVEVGVEIAQKAEKIGGAPTAFGLATTGGYGQVQWISASTDLAGLQRAGQAINADPSFIELLDKKAASAYLSGSSSQIMARRIA